MILRDILFGVRYAGFTFWSITCPLCESDVIAPLCTLGPQRFGMIGPSSWGS